MLQLLFNGIALGCIYALIALGFVQIYNAVGSVNFAQGDLLVVGSYLGILGVTGLGWSILPTTAIVIVGSILLASFSRHLRTIRSVIDRQSMW